MQMTATVRVTPDETRVLVSDATGDRLLARLPALHVSHRWALRALLESMALWSEQRLRVVLYADDGCDWQRLGLTDAFDFATDSLHLDVEVVPQEVRRARAKHLTGLGSFDHERRLRRKAGVRG
jgi:hypothetical protein